MTEAQEIRVGSRLDYEPRVKIHSPTGYIWDAIVTVGDTRLRNVVRAEIVLDAREGMTSAVLHMIDVDVDMDLFDGDTVVVLNEVDRG